MGLPYLSRYQGRQTYQKGKLYESRGRKVMGLKFPLETRAARLRNRQTQ